MRARAGRGVTDIHEYQCDFFAPGRVRAHQGYPVVDAQGRLPGVVPGSEIMEGSDERCDAVFRLDAARRGAGPSVGRWRSVLIAPDMRALYLVSVYLHLLCTAIWIGGMLFFVMVMAPMLRAPAMRAQAPALFAQTGRRFRNIGWATLVTLIATGVVQAAYRAGGLAELASLEWWHTPFGRMLGLKVHLVLLTLALAALHDFWVGPRASALLESESGSARARRWRASASWMGRVNLLLGLVIVWIAVLLVRGPG